MGKKTKVLLAVLLASVLGLVVAWFSSPSLRDQGYQVVLNLGPSSLRGWSIEKLKGLRGAGSKVLALIAMDETEDQELRRELLLHLSALHEESAPAVPALIETLKSKDVEIRGFAVIALVAIGPDAAPAIPALIQMLKDSEERIRAVAAYALGSLCPVGSEAIPALVEALKDDAEDVRDAAQWALDKIGKAPE